MAKEPAARVSFRAAPKQQIAGYFRVESVHNRCAASLADCVIAK
jgi:hypothetical protein